MAYPTISELRRIAHQGVENDENPSFHTLMSIYYACRKFGFDKKKATLFLEYANEYLKIVVSAQSENKPDSKRK